MADFSITLNAYEGLVGDIITISSSGNFSSVIDNNAVIFDGNISAQILSATTSTLTIKVPVGSITGLLFVQTQSLVSDYVEFTVLYPDEVFDNLDPDKILSLLSPNSSKRAVYNRDFGISNFTEIVDEDSIVQNVYNIILTKPGERLFNPEFGCGIHDKIFEIINIESDINVITLNTIEESLNLFEPRVKIDKIQSFVDLNSDKNEIIINLSIILPSGSVKKVTVTIGTRLST